jgi:ferric-dicitrate binding protein FerR (iron transport regulator)
VNPDQLYNYYRTNAFECDGTPLWRLAEKLEEAYNVHITITNDRLRNLTLTTTFAGESLDTILDVIAKSLRITVDHNGREITLK